MSKRFLASALLVATALIGLFPVRAEAAPSLVWSANFPNIVAKSSPLAVDITGDNIQDVLVGDRGGKLHAINGATGTPVPGWPVQTQGGIDSSPSAADTDGDGWPEIFVGSGIAAPGGGGIYSFEHTGQLRFNYNGADHTNGDPSYMSAPALGDVNFNGEPDVVMGALTVYMHVVSQSGNLLPGWPIATDDTQAGSPALADVDGDGDTDIIQPMDSSPGGIVPHRGGQLRAMRGDGSTIWEFNINETIWSSPAVGDIDGDGLAEVVVGAGDYWFNNGGASDSTFLFVINLRTGQLKWKRDLGKQTLGAPALSDLNGDGRLDIAIATWNAANPGGVPGDVWAFNGDGNWLPGFPRTAVSSVAGHITTADVNGDGGQDLFVAAGGAVKVYSGKSGAELLTFNAGMSFNNSATLTDIDNDNRVDVLIAGERSGGVGQLRRYEFSGSDPAVLGTRGWPMFRKDARRTGTWTNSPISQSHCKAGVNDGYWLGAADGGVFSFCDLPFHGSLGNLRLNQPVVGMDMHPNGKGYYFVARDGGVFAGGQVPYFGSAGAIRLNSPIVGMAMHPSGNGYWLVAADGGVFTHGTIPYYGSTGGIALNSPIVGMGAHPSGNGYWLVAADGGVFTFGNIPYHGSTGGLRLNSPIVGMGIHPSGNGYWLVAADGGVFTNGAIPFHGSLGALRLNSPIVSVKPTANGNGYWMVAADGGVFSHGGAPFLGSLGGWKLNSPVVSLISPY